MHLKQVMNSTVRDLLGLVSTRSYVSIYWKQGLTAMPKRQRIFKIIESIHYNTMHLLKLTFLFLMEFSIKIMQTMVWIYCILMNHSFISISLQAPLKNDEE
jgi:hypothetical protein